MRKGKLYFIRFQMFSPPVLTASGNGDVDAVSFVCGAVVI